MGMFFSKRVPFVGINNTASVFGKASIFSTASIFLYNHTEWWRMARNIQRGKLFSSKKTVKLDPSFCQFPLDHLALVAKDGNAFCGLVGLKSTGKTSALELVAKDMTNVVYITMERDDDVCDALHKCLKKSTFHLPWFLDRVRLDSYLTSEDIVREVFKAVTENSGTPVTVLIDISLTPSSMQLPSLSSPGVFEAAVQEPKSLVPSSSFSFDTRSFTRQVKELVESGIMQCLFAATEGLSFQAEAVHEPRLHLFMADELSIPISGRYLQQMKNVVINDEEKQLLSLFPRTFANLDAFAKPKTNRKEFALNKYHSEKSKIMKTGTHGTKVYDVYKLALERDIVIRDLNELNFPLKEFVKLFVVSNIFTMTLEETFKFQFDATASAAKEELVIRYNAKPPKPITIH